MYRLALKFRVLQNALFSEYKKIVFQSTRLNNYINNGQILFLSWYIDIFVYWII